ncbi:exonuclease subunit SbcD [Cohnella sp. CFH 77786]|uniref:exonuclease SbcCD subunit D n=1 Tax=Cohnella sp. CFH 77786 TaxID=2662265 RepID=UPI001C6086E6|nr:exonuclease SbcCD subunit D [Cohnella sp. CFH 77786]MBW5444902.1 exonuclease subunit SbcD [Cohnella sp. CFH 77786]
MRVLHTADWHLGRTLEGRSRLAEQEDFLDQLAGIVREEGIDLVLIAGDVYDSVNPPAAAESLYYDALARLSDNGRRAVAVIAGNHDHPDRVAAATPLAARHGVSMIGMPQDVPISVTVPRTGETAVIAALPYPSEARLNELLHATLDEEGLRSAYSDRVGRLMRAMSESYRPDTVNLAMSHLYLLGGNESESERPIQVGGAYTVHPSALRVGQQYTALGHLHRPQRVDGDETVRYSGSPLAYSFSEAGQAKSVVVFEAAPGAVVQPKELFLSCGRPLVQWKCGGGLAEVHRWLDEGRDANAWIELELSLTEALTMEQIAALRASREGLVQIRPIYSGRTGESDSREDRARGSVPPDELFRRFYRRQNNGAEADDALVRLFLELLGEEAEADTAGEAGYGKEASGT